MKIRSSVRVAATATACALVVAACSSSSGTATGTGSSPSSAPVTLTSAQTAPLLDYTGGKAGKATGTPITIGYINSQGGTNAFPEYTVAVNGAVSLLNSQLGGIGGHPVVLKPCFVASSEEEGQTCAQKFLADSSVVAVLQTALETGAESFHSTLAGRIPVLGVNPTSLSDARAENGYYVEGGQFSAPSIVTYLAKIKKVKSVALLSAAGLPPAVAAAQLLTSGFKAAGISVTQATFQPTGTDFIGPVQASGAAKADALVPLVVTPQQCIAVSNALKQSGIKTPVVTLASCLGASLSDALGDYPMWTYLDFTVNPDAKDADTTVQSQVDAYNAWLPSVKADIKVPGVAVQALQGILTLAKVAGTSTATPTRASMGTALAAFTGPVLLGAPTVKFGSNPALPAIGSPSARFYTYQGKNAWKDETDGKWITAG